MYNYVIYRCRRAFIWSFSTLLKHKTTSIAVHLSIVLTKTPKSIPEVNIYYFFMAKVMDWLSRTPPYTLAANKYGSLAANAFKPQKDCLASVPN